MSDIDEINSEENTCPTNSPENIDNHINLKYLIIPINQYLIDMYDDDMSSYAKFPEMKLINQLRSDYKSIKNKEPYSIRYFGCLNHPKARMIKFLKNNLYDQYYMLPYTLDDGTPKMVTAPSNKDWSKKKWDFLYVRIFKKEFILAKNIDNVTEENKTEIVERILHSFRDQKSIEESIQKNKKLKSFFVATEIYLSAAKEFNEEDFSKLNFKNYEKYEDVANNVIVARKQLLIASKAAYLEFLTNRICLLYMLAYSYIYKIDEFINITEKEKKNISETYEKLLDFNLMYFYMLPLQQNRSSQITEIWKLIYNYYNVGELYEEMTQKISIVASYEINKRRAKSERRTTVILTVITIVVTAVCTYFGVRY